MIMLYTLNLYSDAHQLFLNKTGKKEKQGEETGRQPFLDRLSR